METTLTELILVAATVVFLYKLLKPVQLWLERVILKVLEPGRRSIEDAEIVQDKNHKKR